MALNGLALQVDGIAPRQLSTAPSGPWLLLPDSSKVYWCMALVV